MFIGYIGIDLNVGLDFNLGICIWVLVLGLLFENLFINWRIHLSRWFNI